MEPPILDIFWFGMQVVESNEFSAEDMRAESFYQMLPNLMPSNWWLICAAFADYKEIRELLPLEWSVDEKPVQMDLSALDVRP